MQVDVCIKDPVSKKVLIEMGYVSTSTRPVMKMDKCTQTVGEGQEEVTASFELYPSPAKRQKVVPKIKQADKGMPKSVKPGENN